MNQHYYLGLDKDGNVLIVTNSISVFPDVVEHIEITESEFYRMFTEWVKTFKVC